MTKENFVSINVIVDKSGSMSGLRTDTIGNFNSFLADQKLVPGEAMFTLCTFNCDYQLVHDCAPLHGVSNLNETTYHPSGGTALLDAMGTTIETVGKKLASLPEEERPSKVIFLIITDGQENSSRLFSREQIKNMVTHQQEKYSWNFIFMGANLDAIAEGSTLGISTINSLNYSASPAGTKGLYRSISENMTRYRSSNVPQVDFFNQSPDIVAPDASSSTSTDKDKK